MNDKAVELITTIMTNNAVENQSILTSIMDREMAERDALYFGVSSALARIPWGGTTAEYEAGLKDIRAALLPSYEVLDFYKERARTPRRLNASDVHPSHRVAGYA